ncbi:MAG: hypothetical protein MUP17_11280 [candidate division Zixibacteria bacterium]|nr:hypothetical protein [candidate division Zixibacteria bacterium]
MRFLQSVFRRFLSLFDLSSTQKLRFKGYLSSDFHSMLDKVEKFERVCTSRPCKSYFDYNKRNIVVQLWCFGKNTGFFCDADESNQSPILLPEIWWLASSGDRNVYLFAYACNSSTYLSTSDIANYLTGCMGFRGELWFWFGSDSARTFWIEFGRRLQDLFQHSDAIDLAFSVKVHQLYLSYLKENIEKSRRMNKKEGMFLNLLFLNRHLENLELIQGGKLWTDTTRP